MRYPTLVAAPPVRLHAGRVRAGHAAASRSSRRCRAIEQAKNFSHGIVISLLLAVFFYLALDRVLEPARARIAREAGVGAMVVRTVAGRILGVSLAVTISGFALISLFVLQAFQVMVRESATATLSARSAPDWPPSPDTAAPAGRRTALGRSAASCGWCAAASGCRTPSSRRRRGARSWPAIAPASSHDSRGELKVVGVVEAPRLGGRLVGVIFLTDAYGPLQTAARLLASPAAGDDRHRRHAGLRQPRVDAGRARPVRPRCAASRPGRSTPTCSAWRPVTRSASCRPWSSATSGSRAICATTSRRRSATRPDGCRRCSTSTGASWPPSRPKPSPAAALPRLRSIVPCAWGAVLLFDPEQTEARVMATDGVGGPVEGADRGDGRLAVRPTTVGRYALVVGGEPIGVLCIARSRAGSRRRRPRRDRGRGGQPAGGGDSPGPTLREALDQQQRRLQGCRRAPAGGRAPGRARRSDRAGQSLRARPPGRGGDAVARRST